MNKEQSQWANETKSMMNQTASVDLSMKRMQDELHKITSQHIFEIFPFLSDRMEPDEIRHLGERVERHLHNLSEELKNFAYTVQNRVE